MTLRKCCFSGLRSTANLCVHSNWAPLSCCSAAELLQPWLCIECTTCWLCGINWRLRLFGYCTRKAEAEVYKAFHAIFETECAKEGIVFEINDPELPLGSSTRH